MMLIKRIMYFITDYLCVFKVLVFGFLKKSMHFQKEEKFDKVLIIGNGPSLNKINFYDYIDDKTAVCCVNWFPVKDERFYILKPNFMCFMDPAFFEERKNSENKEKLLKILDDVDWEMTIIIPKCASFKLDNSYIKIFKLNERELYCDHLDNVRYYIYKHNYANCGIRNVILGALDYFISCNYQTVFLCGIDMNEFTQYHVDINNKIYVDYVHSYGLERKYITSDSDKHMHDYLFMYQEMLEQFYYIEKYAKHENVKVYNLSINSFVDVFEKIDSKDKVDGRI